MPRCTDCDQPSRGSLGGVDLCDRCFDRRAASITGYPVLPGPPAPEDLSGPDGRTHRFGYRIWRAPTGIVVEAEEIDCAFDEGYHVEVLGPHDAEIGRLVERVRTLLRQRVGHLDLQQRPGQHPIMAGDVLTGRLVWNGEDGPYDVIVDGRRLSWTDFGRTLEPFEGWGFRLTIEGIETPESTDPIDDGHREPAPRRLH